MILTPLQKLPNNVGNLGKIIVATGFEWLPKVQKSPNLVTLCVMVFKCEKDIGNESKERNRIRVRVRFEKRKR